MVIVTATTITFHPIHPYSMVVVHAHVALLNSFKARSEKKVEATTFTLQSKVNKDSNHLIFSIAQDLKAMIYSNLKD